MRLCEALEHTVLIGDCLVWRGGKNQNGYGVTQPEGRRGKQVYVHRWLWEKTHGPIPEGFTVEHACHTQSSCAGGPSCYHRRCLNIDHLELLTREENASRQSRSRRTHCPQGHEYTETNTYRRKSNGNRQCKTCSKIRVREHLRRKRAAA